MEEEDKRVFDIYFAAAVQGLLANEQCRPFAYAFDTEEVTLKAKRIAVGMLDVRRGVK